MQQIKGLEQINAPLAEIESAGANECRWALLGAALRAGMKMLDIDRARKNEDAFLGKSARYKGVTHICADSENVVRKLDRCESSAMMVKRDWRQPAIAHRVLFRNDLPELLWMGIACVKQAKAAIFPGSLHAFIEVSVAGKRTVPRFEKTLCPAPKERIEGKAQRFSCIHRKKAARGVAEGTKDRIFPRKAGRNPRGIPAAAMAMGAQSSAGRQCTRIDIMRRAGRRAHENFSGRFHGFSPPPLPTNLPNIFFKMLLKRLRSTSKFNTEALLRKRRGFQPAKSS